MDTARALVSKAIQTQAVEDVISENIGVEHFPENDESRAVWETITQHWGQYGAAPSLDAIRQAHPDFKLELTSDVLPYVIKQFKNDFKRRKAITLGRDYRDAIDDPNRIEDIGVIAFEMARQLNESFPTPELHRFSDMKNRIEDYDRRLEDGVEPGTKINIPTIDDWTQGIRDHDFWVIMAFLNVGKSTLMQWIFYQLYLNGKTPLMISLEMGGQELLERFDSMAAHVRHKAIMAMQMDSDDREKWERMAERADEDKHERDIIIRDDIYDCTVDRIQAEIARWKPDLCGIDYIGLMHAPGGAAIKNYEKVQYNTRRIKQMARVGRVPILAAAQANRDGHINLSIENTAESIGVAQDCDVMIGLEAQGEDEVRRSRIEGLLLKNRKGPKKRGIWLNFDLINAFDIYEITHDMLTRPRHEEGGTTSFRRNRE